MIFLHEKIDLQNGKFIDNGFWEVKDAITFPEVGEKIILENYNGGHHCHTVQPKDEFIEGYWENLMKIYATEISKEKYGWIDRDDTADRTWFCDGYLTRAQYNKLVELGFENIEDEKIE